MSKKKAWHSTKNGMVRGICTNSCMPHHKPKRTRKSRSEEPQPSSRVTIDLWAVVFAIQSFAFVPTNLFWKSLLAIAFLVQGLKWEEK